MKVEIEIQTKPEKDILERKGNSSEVIFNLDEVQAIKDAIQEHLLFIGMDKCNNIKNIRLIGIGKCDEISIDSKEIVRTALLTASERVVLVHNHPSNNSTPSKRDLYLTNYTYKILKIFNIEMVDHIIVTEREYHSMTKYNDMDFQFSNDKLEFVQNTFLEEENEKLKREIKEMKAIMGKSQKNKYKEDR